MHQDLCKILFDEKQIAERVGGCILILIGTKILLEGLGRWPF